MPTVQENCTAYCEVQPGPDTCAFDRCACTGAGDFCGGTLPVNCSYKPDTVYTCTGDRTLPTEKLDCQSTEVCLETPAGPICTSPDCICKDNSTICGSSFVSACGLANNTLYSCTAGLLPSVAIDCNPGICSANIVTGTATFRALADDRCIDQCACKEAGVQVHMKFFGHFVLICATPLYPTLSTADKYTLS